MVERTPPSATTGRLNSAEGALGAILDEFAERLQQGPAPTLEEFLQRFPEHAVDLRTLLPAARVMASLGPENSELPVRLPSEPRELGDYRLIRVLGRGGMGVVYEAEQLSLGRRVALKVLPFTDILDPRQLQRFKNEARAAATLDHPHIVHVYAVGQERGVHFYAMQLIEGQSLAEFLKQSDRWQRPETPIAPGREAPPTKRHNDSTALVARQSTIPAGSDREYFRQVARWGIEAAQALDYAHQLGIIHRDIKPSNLLINAEGKLWVADFGLAVTRGDPGLTMTGDVLGTLRYMSPEQALGQHGVVDQRSDTYSLGMTLYELLAGRPAFDGAERAQILQMIAQDDPAPLTRIAAAIPAELETIIFKAIDKDPAARYSTAKELADDLGRFLNDQPLHARPPTLRDRLIKWSRRHRALASSLMVAACISLCSAGTAAFLILHERQQVELERIARRADQAVAALAHKHVAQQRYASHIVLADQALMQGNLKEALAQLNECEPQGQADDLRGVEWHYLRRQCDPELRVIGQHMGSAYHVVASPNGHLLSSCGQDGIRIWDLQTNEPLRHLTDHNSEVGRTGFSPDGRWLVSVGGDNAARIWDTQTWSPVHTLPHANPVIGGIFSANGRWLLTADRVEDPPAPTVDESKNIATIWDTQTWNPRATLVGHLDRIAEVELSDDGATAVTIDRQGIINIWGVPDGALRHSIQHFSDTAEWTSSAIGLGLAHRHGWGVTTGMHGTVSLWNLADGQPLTRLSTAMYIARCAAFAPDDQYLLVGGDQASVHAWRLLANDQFDEAHTIALDHFVWWMSFLDQREVAIADDGGTIWRWRLENPADVLQFQGTTAATTVQVVVSPNGRELAHTLDGLRIKSLPSLMDPESTRPDIVLDPEFPPDGPIAFAPDTNALVTARGNIWTIWSTWTWQPVKSISVPERITGLRFRDAGERLCVQTEGLHAFRWFAFPSGTPARDPRPLLDGGFLASSRTHRNAVQGASGDWVFRDGDRVLWSRQLPHNTAEFSGDGTRVAVATPGGHIDIYDAATGDLQSIIPARSGWRGGLEFSPDGQTLASHSAPKMQITLSQVSTGRDLLTMNTGLRTIQSVQFTPDGAWLAVAGVGRDGRGEVQLIRCGPHR